MKTVFVLLVILVLAGCSGFSTVKYAVAIEGAKVADEALQVSEWGLCEATTVGAWKRKFGQNPEKAEAWTKLCSDKDVVLLK